MALGGTAADQVALYGRPEVEAPTSESRHPTWDGDPDS